MTQTNITVNSSGKHVEDSRGTKAARDGASYTKEAVYTVDVKNTYTGQETIKTIYVGSDPFLIALANTGLSVQELDDTLAQGYTLGDDGSLIAPADPEPEVEEKVADAAEAVEEEQKTEAAEISPEYRLVTWNGYPLDVIKQFHTKEEYEVFKQAGLKSEMINGKLALVRNDIDLNAVDEYGLFTGNDTI